MTATDQNRYMQNYLLKTKEIIQQTELDRNLIEYINTSKQRICYSKRTEVEIQDLVSCRHSKVRGKSGCRG